MKTKHSSGIAGIGEPEIEQINVSKDVCHNRNCEKKRCRRVRCGEFINNYCFEHRASIHCQPCIFWLRFFARKRATIGPHLYT